jgi:serine protease Do
MRSAGFTILLTMCLALSAYGRDKYPTEWNGSFAFSSDGSAEGESYLGVDTRDITPDRLGPLHLKEETGAEVTMVDQDAPAGKAGIKEHDVIMTINGQQVQSVEELRRLIHEIPPGRTVTIGVLRAGQALTLKAQLADRTRMNLNWTPQAKEFKFEMPTLPSIPDIDVPVSVVVVHSALRSGLMVENMTSQLGDFFGVKNGQGILVRSVEKGSRAEKAGFRAGDVIVRVNGEAICDSGDFSRLLHSRKDNTVSIGIIRDRKEQTLTFSLPDRKQSRLSEESPEFPEIDADMRDSLQTIRSQMAQLRPEMHAYAEQMQCLHAQLKKGVQQEMRVLNKAMGHDQRRLLEEQQKMKLDVQELIKSETIKGRADI